VVAATGQVTELLRSDDLVTAAALSPDLRLLYYAKLPRDTMFGGTIWLRDLAGTMPRGSMVPRSVGGFCV